MERFDKVFLITLMIILVGSCKREVPVTEGQKTLPRLGRFEVSVNQETGKVDTLWHKVGDFSFTDQDSLPVTPSTFTDKVYVADFFFTTCPDICPKMKTQLLRVYERYLDDERIMLLSHTIDPKNDSVSVLKDYAERLGVRSDRWKFVTGEKEEIYKVGQTSYMASMAEESGGGFTHSGRFFLIDREKHVRGAYDGTDPNEVDKMMEDMEILLNEQFGETR